MVRQCLLSSVDASGDKRGRKIFVGAAFILFTIHRSPVAADLRIATITHIMAHSPHADELSDHRLHLAPGVWVSTTALVFSTSRSGGAGGQHVNKTESRVELRLPICAIVGLTPAMRIRLVTLAGSRLTCDGELILFCDETRSRGRNQDLVVERFRQLVLEAHAVPRMRRATKPSRASKERRLTGKRVTALRKHDRSHRGDSD